ncbi:methyltransferase type 12 [Halothece sp. PCC 7418]|uniref:class I SAM-dependent methyltransferase n=1 Tax=Halothece sp. (strain PCC 7418) TaxID=65093 RepID=UPI0002A05B8A|nr:class I SAM-dependent methyltransferase [Halothece sp. PCC 7418]AFZ44057.1 methyltransferase type 12 [Halothece sp. PCC 7418]
MFCPVCHSSRTSIFFEMLNVPVFCNVLWSEQQAAKTCQKGDIRLAFCSDCGFIYNTTFDSKLLDYCPDYENSLDFSPRFQAYAKSLGERLIKKYNLYQKKIIEIGCGKGDFLSLLCELGENRGVGFDPSYIEHTEILNLVRDRVEFVQDVYSEKYRHYQGDFICCRHTLEHIEQPRNLLTLLRENLETGDEVPIFFEVPNAIDTFRRMAIWDIIYEHCCYFSPVSLSYIFASCGFEVKAMSEEFQGQFLTLEAEMGKPKLTFNQTDVDDLKTLSRDVDVFAQTFNNKLISWQKTLKNIADNGQKAVTWGAGSKGVTFLNLIQEQTTVEYIVDINPRKQGKYVAGTGQQIVEPEFLSQYQPDVIIVMNSVYQDEIKHQVHDLGLNSELMFV